jgi:MHS family alpha-ketoglutarate permease-like MFS transporter
MRPPWQETSLITSSIAHGDRSSTVGRSGEPRPAVIRSILVACSGNVVEWFDFFAYAFTALYFAPAFFPTGDTTSQLLNTAGIFAAGFFMRPVGGWLFGRRDRSLVFSMR